MLMVMTDGQCWFRFTHTAVVLLSCISNGQILIPSVWSLFSKIPCSEALAAESPGFCFCKNVAVSPIRTCWCHSDVTPLTSPLRCGGRKVSYQGATSEGGLPCLLAPQLSPLHAWRLESYDDESIVYVQCYAPWTWWGFRKCGVCPISSEGLSHAPSHPASAPSCPLLREL